MKLLLVLTFATLAQCGEIDDFDPKKRGATKTSILNAIQSNENYQKAEQYSYLYQQQPSSHQQPVQQGTIYSNQNQHVSSYFPTLPAQGTGSNVYSSIATNTEGPTIYSNSQNPYSITSQQPPYYPIQFLSQSPLQSKIQLVPAKLVNGQIQIIGQPSISTPQIYSAQETNHQTSVVQPSGSNPQYSGSVHQSNAIPAQASYAVSPNGGYLNQAPSPFYQHESSVGQMVILTQPVPQFYNNYLNPSPLFSNTGQQLLQYYQSHPQARYHLLNSGHTSNSNYNDYQQPSTSSEYNKSLPGPKTQKSENDLSVSEYTSPPESDTSYKSNTYSTREQVYKTS